MPPQNPEPKKALEVKGVKRPKPRAAFLGSGGHPGHWPISELARTQHGAVALWQLLAAGMTRGQIRAALAAGDLHRVHQGVYAVGHPGLSQEGRFMAAVLAHGEGALLSHFSAATLWGVWSARVDREHPVDVTLLGRRAQRPGIHLHCVRVLDDDDRDICRGIPITSPARTLLDLSRVLYADRALARAVHHTDKLGLAAPEVIRRRATRAGGYPHAVRLARLAAKSAKTRSFLEDDALELMRAAGLPEPVVNRTLRIAGLGRVEVDFLFPEQRVIVETDGKRYHDSAAMRRSDDEVQAHLEAAGYRVVRLNHEQVHEYPDMTLLRIGRALAGG
jgi:very-short-patch-repair endonuclease